MAYRPHDTGRHSCFVRWTVDQALCKTRDPHAFELSCSVGTQKPSFPPVPAGKAHPDLSAQESEAEKLAASTSVQRLTVMLRDRNSWAPNRAVAVEALGYKDGT